MLCLKSTGCIFHCMNIKLTSDVRYYWKRLIHSPCSRWYSRRYREANLHFWLIYLSTSLLLAFLLSTYLYSSCSLQWIVLTTNSMWEAKCILELATEVRALIKLEKCLVVKLNFLRSHLFQWFTVRIRYSIFGTTPAEKRLVDGNLLFRR